MIQVNCYRSDEFAKDNEIEEEEDDDEDEEEDDHDDNKGATIIEMYSFTK